MVHKIDVCFLREKNLKYNNNNNNNNKPNK